MDTFPHPGATILVSGEAVQFGEIFRDGIIIERAGNILIQILRIGIELSQRAAIGQTVVKTTV